MITTMEKRLRISGILVILGLLVEAFSLLWSHPIAFLVFMFVGGAFMGVGILFYLYSLVSPPHSRVEH
jgi:hypothetical protein